MTSEYPASHGAKANGLHSVTRGRSNQDRRATRRGWTVDGSVLPGGHQSGRNPLGIGRCLRGSRWVETGRGEWRGLVKSQRRGDSRSFLGPGLQQELTRTGGVPLRIQGANSHEVGVSVPSGEQ
jgi:hypothetical protein